MADIGTDHGSLPLWCLENEIVPYAVLSDVNEGPLERARQRMESSFVAEDRYDLRLGNGLSVLQPGEVQTIVIAGMGGELIASILEADPDVAQSVERFVFQPRSRAGALRVWLWTHGWRICEEKLARERGRLCQVFAAEKGTQEPYEFPDIPAGNDPLMIEFLDKELVNIKLIYENLLRSNGPDAQKTLQALQRKAKALEQRRDGLWKSRYS